MNTEPQTEIERLREKVATYERVLHDINMYAAITLDRDSMARIIDMICNWSYAHRVGNGELDDEEQSKIIQRAYARLKFGEYHKPVSDCVYGSK